MVMHKLLNNYIKSFEIDFYYRFEIQWNATISTIAILSPSKVFLIFVTIKIESGHEINGGFILSTNNALRALIFK
jgi:hypothetical protein